MRFPPFQSKREFAKKVTYFEQLQRLTWDLGCRVPWGLHSLFLFVCGGQGWLWRKDNKSHLYCSYRGLRKSISQRLPVLFGLQVLLVCSWLGLITFNKTHRDLLVLQWDLELLRGNTYFTHSVINFSSCAYLKGLAMSCLLPILSLKTS